jgi:hypothetical protein
MVVRQIEPLYQNGKIYQNGETVMERVVLSEEMFKTVDERDLQIRLIPLETTPPKELRPLSQMNKDQLIEESKKYGLVLGKEEYGKAEMINLINEAKANLEKGL